VCIENLIRIEVTKLPNVMVALFLLRPDNVGLTIQVEESA